MKTYQEPMLEVCLFDSDVNTADILQTSKDPNATFNKNDVIGDDPGFWRGL